MEKVREIFIYGCYFWDFYHQQPVKVKDRINRVLNTIMKTRKNKLVSLDEHLNHEYGKRGTPRREKFEQDSEILS